ncbi:MAG: prolyl oligopeptidase family serine peptidase, partial [Actinomycetota bacterium]|nr:prolyl oligopeptidase family serine peptidase [Actinomycetota bacterium]
LVPATTTGADAVADPAATVRLAAAITTAAAPPVVAVAQTPPLAWLQQIPVIGPIFVTPVVAAIHLIPVVGDVIHPFIGYPVEPGAPGAPLSRDVMITSFDGTQIYVHFMPASGLTATQKATTVLEGPGLGMPGSTSLEVTPLDGILTDALGAVGVGTLRDAGYNVVTWDPRGEYRSGGMLELDSADYEAKDVSAIISWLATQSEVTLDSPGDPRVGMVGASYGGGIQWTAAATDRRIDAIVPSISWNTLNTSLYKSEAFKSGWGTLLTVALLATGARPNPAIYPAAIQGDLTGTLTQDQQDLLAQRGPDYLLKDVTAPTLIIQGTVDTLFSLQEAQDNALVLIGKGVPTKVLYFCGGHGLCTNNLVDPTDGQVVTTETLAWLAHYLKGQEDVSTGPVFEWVDQRGQYYSSKTFPASPGVAIVGSRTAAGVLPLVPLIGGSGPLLGVLPIGATKAANALNLTVAAATATTYVVGAPRLSLTYSGTGTSTHVFAQLVDDSTGAVLGNQATPIPVVLDGQTHTITDFSLEQVVATLSPGQTVTLQLVASTANYENLGAFGVLTVSNMQVSLPTITDAVAVNTSSTSV